MQIEQYFNEADDLISFSRRQGSDFAKQVADDFNPLHNANSKRFCVPGDLLFAVILNRYGCYNHMEFTFSGMVTDDVRLIAPSDSMVSSLKDVQDKEYLKIDHAGDNSTDKDLISNLIQSYVSFSGHTFPYILVPLMENKGMMINPARPMVMYQSMLIELDNFSETDISLELDKNNTEFEVNGKRGKVCLSFNLITAKGKIGRGEKHMLASGLKPYDKEAMEALISDYGSWKEDYFSAR